MMFCTTLLFHSILYTKNNLTQKLGRGAELITTNYTTGWSLVHNIWTCNKETLYISVNYVFWHPARLPQKAVHARRYLNQLYGNSSEQVSEWIRCFRLLLSFNRLKPNDPYMGRTAPLTSKRCILYIYSTNVGTEYFKHALYSRFFFLFKMQFVS